MAARQKMSPADAQTFDRYSPVNATIAESGCANGCHAYGDIFTFARWIAQGRVVRKGEHGTRIPVIIHSANDDGESITLRRTSVVFCRCQTDALMPRSAAVPA